LKRHYVELWALLALAFVIFAVASAFDTPFKSAEIVDSILPHKAEISALPDTTITPEAKTATVECDTANQVILLIGDSMLEGLSPRLAAYARHNGHTLYSVIWYSSTSEIWGQSDKLRRYIARLKPTFIFISLGANELFVRDIATKRKKHVDAILRDIGDIPYVWIGPPNWAEDTGINELISTSTPQGAYFRSKGMSFERSSDGAHPTPSSAMEWLDSIVRWMPSNALHPIRLEIPSDSTARPHRTFVHQPHER